LGTFGEKLRKQRELRGITLESVANTTKISTRMLQALEDEHFDQLPGGVFNKGFVRAYARQVGLDEEEAITDYLAALAEGQAQSQAILPNFRAAAVRPAPEISPSNDDARGKRNKIASRDRRTHPDRRVEARRSRDRQNEDRQNEDGRNGKRHEDDLIAKRSHHNQDRATRVDAAVVESNAEQDPYEELPTPPASFLNLSAPSQARFEGSSYEGSTQSESSAASSHRVRWEMLAIPLILIALAVALWAIHRRGSHPAMASQPTVTQSSPTSSSVATSSAAPPASLKPTPAAIQSTTRDTATPPDSDVTTSVVGARTQISKPKPPPTFTLTIRASETSWVAITADDQPVATETLIAPANTSVRAAHEITVKAGNAAGVSFLLNGKEFPAEGASGEVRTYTFDANGLRDTADTSTPN
jgi:cytoskeletal protein RodZ